MDYDIGRTLHDLDARLKRIERSARLSHASLDGTAITVKDGTGTVRGAIGMQPDGTLGLIAVGGPPPGAPTTPVVNPSIGGLRVIWDGALADGSALPADFAHIAVHISTTSGFTPSAATFVGTITASGDGGMLPVTPLPYEAHYVVLIAVNSSGIPGPASAETASTPLQVEGPDLVAGSVTAGHLQAGSVTAEKLEAILQLASRIVAGDPAGARVELNEDGLRVYNGSDVLVIQFNAADGSAVFSGDITGSDISGSTVTGGLIQTAASGERITINEGDDNKIFIYDAAGVGVASLTPGGIGLIGPLGNAMAISPATTLPSIRWFNVAGTKVARMQASEMPSGAVNLSTVSSHFTSGGFTDWVWQHSIGEDSAYIERLRDNGLFTTYMGGALYLQPTYARLTNNNSADPTLMSRLTLDAALAYFENRLEVLAPASANSALYVQAATAHTGNLLRLYRDGDKLTVDKDGNLAAAGGITATTTTWQTYTPTVSGGGTATYTSRTGFYYKLGKVVHFQAEFVVNAAGSGASAITITAPSSIYRTGGRQAFACHGQSTTTAGAVMNGHAVALESGTGTTIDRISLSNDGAANRDNILNGANLLAGARVTIQGWYREA